MGDDEPFLPGVSGSAPFEPSPEDWADYHVQMDRIDRENPMTDRDIMAAGLPPG